MNHEKSYLATVADSFVKHFERIFHCCYPCDRGSNETLQEANLTTNLLRALLELDSSSFTWDEFPIPSEVNVNPNSNTKNRIDSVIINSNEKAITMIESKCLKRAGRRKSIPCQSIGRDIARMINVANHDGIFPDRIWKNDGINERPEPLGNEYNEYSTFGITACGLWWPGKQQVREAVEDMFAKDIEQSLGNIYANVAGLKGKICNDKVEVRKVELPKDIVLCGKEWQYFLILYSFKIRKETIRYVKNGSVLEARGGLPIEPLNKSSVRLTDNPWGKALHVGDTLDLVIDYLSKKKCLSKKTHNKKGGRYIYLRDGDLSIWLACDDHDLNAVIGAKSVADENLKNALKKDGWEEWQGGKEFPWQFSYLNPLRLANLTDVEIEQWLKNLTQSLARLGLLAL